MKKIIAFSLWGDQQKYLSGAIENARLAKIIFPEWVCYFYYDHTVPLNYITMLSGMDNVVLIKVTNASFGAFWRFFDMVEGNIILSRDTDSRLSFREKQIIDDWLVSKEKMCVIRDHINHYDFPILAGMWGIKNGLPDGLYEQMKRYWSTHTYTIDQIYLKDVVWPALKNDCKEYGIQETLWMRESYTRIGKDFIGQSYSETGQPVYEAKLQ